MRRLPPALAFVFLLLVHSEAADNKELWDSAAASYDAGEYPGAVEQYSKLIEKGFVSPELYYNLGNSYYKSGGLGPAIWAYRRALKLDPGMEQARTNLEYVREFNLDKIEVQRGGFILDIWNFFTGLTTVDGFILIFSVGWWCLAIILVRMILKPIAALWPHYLLILSLVVAIFTGAAAVTRVRQDRLARWGVLVTPSADIREGPGDEFEKIEIGHEGLEFKILSEREKNYLIELKNGLRGWVAAETVLEI